MALYPSILTVHGLRWDLMTLKSLGLISGMHCTFIISNQNITRISRFAEAPVVGSVSCRLVQLNQAFALSLAEP